MLKAERAEITDPAGKYCAHQKQAAPVRSDELSVHADGQTPLHISSIAFGSIVHVLGPETDTFTVTDDTITLAFTLPGQYTVRIRAPEDTRVPNALVTAL